VDRAFGAVRSPSAVTGTTLTLHLSIVPRHAETAARPRPARPSAGRPASTALVGGLAIAAGAASLGLLCATLFFFHLGTYGLWEPDEARYAEIAREILATGEFVVPHLNYVTYIEKPPLLYWLTAFSMWVFGVNEFAARFLNAAAAMLGAVATYFFVLRTFDPRRALLATAVLATSALYAVMAQVLTTDMLLTALTAVALFAFFLHWRDGGAWCWVFYVAMGLAVLTKGPVGVAIPILIALIFLWRERDLAGIFRRFHVAAGLAITLAISAPWFIAITLRVPGFFDFYFVGEYVRRVFEPSYSHGQPIYYYVPIIFLGLLPWSLLLPFLRWRAEPNPARRFCIIAAPTIFVLFSLASAKLIPYILPAIPLCAILIADAIMNLVEASRESSIIEAQHAVPDVRRLAAIGPLLGITGAGLVAVALRASDFTSPYPMLVRSVLSIAAAILLTGGIVCFVAFWQRRAAIGLALLVITATGVLVAGGNGRLIAEPTRSYARLARTIAEAAPNATLVCYPRYIQSLPFYCRRRVILVGAKTELAFGAAHDPDASKYFFTTRADLLRLWNAPGAFVFVIDRDALAPIRNSLTPYRLVASDAKKLAIAPVHNETRQKNGDE
jgi:4-amino-4-deoxy-L-arabinose transferase-like glycosyltransferase